MNQGTGVMGTDHESAPEGKKRRQNGRSWRRRKAKLKAIEAAEEQLLNGLSSSSTAATMARRDKERSHEGTLERRRAGGISLDDERVLIGQLGYVPGNAVSIVARSDLLPGVLRTPESVPVVLKLYPLALRESYAGGKKDGRKFKGRKRGRTAEPQPAIERDMNGAHILEPFPTLYWLTHPLLKTTVSRLELGKCFNARVLERRLLQDAAALDSMKRAHAEYGMERQQLMTQADKQLLESKGWTQSLEVSRGIAGIRKPHAIKCLHAHVAHYLSGGRGSQDNVVGRWVMEEIERNIRDKIECNQKEPHGCQPTDEVFPPE